jgi:hypothetical protein
MKNTAKPTFAEQHTRMRDAAFSIRHHLSHRTEQFNNG